MSDFNVTFEENDQHITLDFKEAIGTVQSINGKIGDVVLDAGDLEYDDTETYSSGSVGDELSTLKEELDNLDTGITPEQQALLISILRNGVYDENVKSLIDELEESFSGIIHITGINFAQSSLSITDIDPVTVNYIITPADGTDPILWASSDQNVITVANGVITPIADGSATITAYTSRGVSATLSVTVNLPTTYSVTNNLSNATNSNNSDLIVEGNSYTGVITADNGYKVTSVTVTMGGTDITNTVYANGTISIPSVTGNIVITVNTTVMPLYSFKTGSYAYENGAYIVTVSNGNHVKIEGVTGKSYQTVNFSHVGEDVNQASTFFTVPNGATVIATIKNASLEGTTAFVSLRGFDKGAKTHNDFINNRRIANNLTGTFTAPSDLDLGSIGMYLTSVPSDAVYEFDIEITVNGALYIG